MDRLSAQERSDVMRKVRSTGTRPEVIVASLLRSTHHRFTSHDRTLPGNPDFVLARHKLVVFVHGCFWHCHCCRRGRSTPATHRKFWAEKRAKNVARDRRVSAALRRRGFRVMTIWECALKNPDLVKAKIRARLKGVRKRSSTARQVGGKVSAAAANAGEKRAG